MRAFKSPNDSSIIECAKVMKFRILLRGENTQKLAVIKLLAPAVRNLGVVIDGVVHRRLAIDIPSHAATRASAYGTWHAQHWDCSHIPLEVS